MEREEIARRLRDARRDLLESKRRVEEDELVGDIEASDIAEPRDTTEAAAELLERELDQTMMGLVAETLAEIEAAEARLAAGTYGRCEVCGESIGAARLEAIPWARRCITHEQHREQARTGLEVPR